MNDKEGRTGAAKSQLQLNAPTVDAKGLPLRMKFDKRRLDQPYGRAKRLRFSWNRFDGVVIRTEEG